MKLFIVSVGKKGFFTEVRCLKDEYKRTLQYNNDFLHKFILICGNLQNSSFSS